LTTGSKGAGKPELVALHAAAAEVTDEERKRPILCSIHQFTGSSVAVSPWQRPG
jgi:hypothetical protein